MQHTTAFTNNVLTQAANKLANNPDVREMFIDDDAGYYDNIDGVLAELVSAADMQALSTDEQLIEYVYGTIDNKLATLITTA